MMESIKAMSVNLNVLILSSLSGDPNCSLNCHDFKLEKVELMIRIELIIKVLLYINILYLIRFSNYCTNKISH